MLLRKNDRLWAFELHPSDFKNLEKNFKHINKNINLEKSDGFLSYRKLLPPISRRGLVLIDPPYEDRRDYQKTVRYVKESLEKFATGIFIIWLPDIQRYEVKTSLKKLENLKIKSFYHLNVRLKKVKYNSLGLKGSNLIIINPPYGIESKLQEVASFMESNLTFHE
jgi:23S rRNA (adenine2030-N6)-methyltransferase